MTISRDDVMLALCAVAARNPDQVDSRIRRPLNPRYLDAGEPSCIVAHVLLRVKFSRGQLKELNRERNRWGEVVVLPESTHPALKRLSPPAREALEYAQRLQDYGYTWGRIADNVAHLCWNKPA